MNKVILFLLVFAVCLSSTAFLSANAMPASDYIRSYSASTYRTGPGNIKVTFEIGGTRTMDDIGSTSIYLYELNGTSWSLVQTFLYTQSSYSHIMTSNTAVHSASVTYAGTSGKQYYATVYLWAGRNGGGDSRSVTTSAVTA